VVNSGLCGEHSRGGVEKHRLDKRGRVEEGEVGRITLATPTSWSYGKKGNIK
jgi:hypothetical protein